MANEAWKPMRSRETEIGPIPEDWDLVSFASIREWLQYGTSVPCSVEPTGYPVLRIPNIAPGSVSTTDLKYCSLDDAEADRYLLEEGDLLFIRTNGVLDRLGSCAVYSGVPTRALFASYLIRARLRRNLVEPSFVAHFLGSERGTSLVASRATPAADGKYNLNTATIDSLPLPLPPSLREQRHIAQVLTAIQDVTDRQKKLTEYDSALKSTVMHELFTRGLRGKSPRQTDIGPVPADWTVDRLDTWADIISSTRMSYSELETLTPSTGADALPVLGLKVSDMNLPKNETMLVHSRRMATVDRAVVERRCAPPGTIVFPKRGAAIATNKKRLTANWAVFDPNVIGVRAREKVDERFLFHWFLRFDLRAITEPGPTPQLNKKNLEPLLVPVPRSPEEQREIVETLDTIDRKIDLHKRKRAALEDLYRTLLHKLMTGEICVSDLDLSALATPPPTHEASV